jgi:Transposase DDE domain
MSTLAQVSQAMQHILTSAANEAARTSQFTQRLSKLSGAKFAQLLTFGWWDNPDASYDELVHSAAVLGLTISAQGLAERFTPAAATYLQSLLGTAVQQVIESEPGTVPLLQRFQGVYLQDSTVLSLPAALAALWPGSGNQSQPHTAGLKVQLRYNLSDGHISDLDLQPARAHDHSAPMQSKLIAPGALRLADLGYLDLGLMAAEQAQGSYWLTRWQAQVKLYTADDQLLDLKRVLRRSRESQLELPIRLGQQQRLPCRLLASRVPPSVTAKRRRRLKQEAKRKGQAISPMRWALAGWTLLLTNVPPAMLSLPEALVVARLRWQIELVFKLWKDAGHMDQSRSQKPYRILCELYTKLLIAVFQHWVLLTVGWDCPQRSLRQLARRIRKHVMALAAALASAERCIEVLGMLQRVLTPGARINKRKQAPNAAQLMESVTQPLLA